MSHHLSAKTMFAEAEVAEFRLYVLAGARRLACEDVTQLAEQLQECVRERQSWPASARACDGEGAFDRVGQT